MRFINDPSHGWLEVSLLEYPEAWDYGTGFGYLDLDKSLIYLEEDFEAYKFCEYLFKGDLSKAREIPEKNFDSDCFVRKLPKNEKVLTY